MALRSSVAVQSTYSQTVIAVVAVPLNITETTVVAARSEIAVHSEVAVKLQIAVCSEVAVQSDIQEDCHHSGRRAMEHPRANSSCCKVGDRCVCGSRCEVDVAVLSVYLRTVVSVGAEL